MRKLYHLWLDPFSRKARLVLGEKGMDFDPVIEKPWERREGFLRLNPAGEVPVLVEENGTAISGATVIAEYLDEIHPNPPLIGSSPIERAEVRRLCHWFDHKFNEEVTANLVEQKVTRRIRALGSPDSAAIRAGLSNIRNHLDYITFLVERRDWLAGERLSLADLTAAAHLSSVDYLGDVPWDSYPSVKDWYVRLKSRPGFRQLLHDLVPGVQPPAYYTDLDF